MIKGEIYILEKSNIMFAYRCGGYTDISHYLCVVGNEVKIWKHGACGRLANYYGATNIRPINDSEQHRWNQLLSDNYYHWNKSNCVLTTLSGTIIEQNE